MTAVFPAGPATLLGDEAAAYLLVTHGSRDPRSHQGAAQLAAQLHQHLPPGQLIETAVLELGPAPLHQQIAAFAQRAQAQGRGVIQILPLFLLAGVHVRDDLPQELSLARGLTPLSLRVLPHLGAGEALLPVLLAQRQWLQAKLLTAGTTANAATPHWLLVAHGSRRPGAATTLADWAMALGAEVTYWVGQPSLGDRLTALLEQDCAPVGILSCFLFAGGITDGLQVQVQAAIAATTGPAAVEFSPPLAAFPQLAATIAQGLIGP